MAEQRVLIVDDESVVRFGVRKYLNKHGYEVEESDSIQSAEQVFHRCLPDAVVLDYRLPDGNGLELLLRLKAIDSDVPVIILTGHGSIDLAVQAMKEGAEHFLTKPLEMPALLVLLTKCIENRRNRQKQKARQSRQQRQTAAPFLGDNPAIQRLADQARKVVASERPILIQGETGTGKSLLAQWLHNNSPRANEPFVDLNCAGLSREFLETELLGHEKGAFTGAVASKQGLLEVANRGTLFLDEVGDMDLQIQPKLLKVLEEKRFRRLGDVRDRRVDTRLIAATHQDISLLVREKKFRSDLYFRISAIPLVIPSLRDRNEDTPLIAQQMLFSIGTEMGCPEIRLSLDAIEAIRSYRWPGNIRELRNVLDRAVLLRDTDVIDLKDLSFDLAMAAEFPAPGESITLDDVERQHIEKMLIEENGSVKAAARRLNMPKSSLYYRIKRHGIVPQRIAKS